MSIVVNGGNETCRPAEIRISAGFWMNRSPTANSAPSCWRCRASRRSRPRRCGCLAAGRPLNEAAAEAGVDRGTLYRWRTQDEQFMASLNAWRSETQAHARDRLLSLLVEIVAPGIDTDNARCKAAAEAKAAEEAREAEAKPSLEGAL